jgi:GTPase SAR1 family protein
VDELNFEEGAQALDDLKQWAADHEQELGRNEAQTRIDLIDRLFLECLGWPREQVRVERHRARTFTDYEFGVPYSRLVVEAKRESVYFELPAGWSQRTCTLSTLLATNDDVADAIRQALGYAQSRGIPVAAVTNGWQLIAFLASRTDGISPLEGTALVFPTLRDMSTDFRMLWDNLSAAGIDASRIFTTLRQDVRPLPPPKLSARINGYPGLVRRTELQQSMQILGEVFIEDLASVEENELRFLRSCYASSGALSQYALVSREILRTRYALLFDEHSVTPVAATGSHGIDPYLISDIAAASVKHRPILLLGDVGVGKSTFIRNLIHVEAREQLQNAIVLYLDFGKRPTISPDLELYVGNEIKRQLFDDQDIDVGSDSFIRGVYHGRLEQFANSLYGPFRESDPTEYARQELRFLADLIADTDEHLRQSLEHITRARKRQVVIFLDNIDQRDESFQDRLYIIAQTMAESWPVTVFLALRPETFHRSKRTGALAAYQPRAFTISPPRVEEVLRKRLAFALEKLREQGLRTRTGVELHVDIGTLERYLSLIEHSIAKSDELVEFFENASGGNVREALGFVEAFVGSGHIDLQRTLDRIGSSGRIRYTVPVRDLWRAVLYGEAVYYDPTRSPIPNLFDIREPVPEEHFLVALLLGFISDRGAMVDSEGFVDVGHVVHFAQSLGFRPDQIAGALEDARTSRLLTARATDTDGSHFRAWRITTLGSYSIARLVRSFTYLDAIVVDTPVLDSEARGQLEDLRPIGNMESRLARADRFIDYLDNCWNPLAAGSLPFDWPAVAAAVRTDIRDTRQRVTRRPHGPETGSAGRS